MSNLEIESSSVFPKVYQAQMPLQMQDIFFYGSLTAAIALLIYAIFRSRQEQSALPVLFIVGALCCLPAEPVCNYLGQLFHAQIGQIMAFETMDRKIPWHVVFLYVIYFGAVPLFAFGRICSRKLTSKYLVNAYIGFVAFAYALEIVPVSSGMWVYYGNQALWLWKGSMPLHWALTNPLAVLTPLMLIYVAYPRLNGIKQILVVPLMAAGALMGYEGVAFVWQIAANSNWGVWFVQGFGLVSIAMAWLLLWFYCGLLEALNGVHDASDAQNKGTLV